MALLELDNLSIAIAQNNTLVPVVHDCSFALEAHDTLGIVGESGCGKSLTALSIMGLLEGSQVRITAGSIHFDGVNLLELDTRQRRAIMGDRMAMIFQEPMTSLNPVYRIGEQITETLQQHRRLSRKNARHRALELLDLVQIPEPHKRINSFPHQLSGGQRQRVMIAIAMACDPALLIADEPTTALDVTVQKEVLDLMLDLQRRTGTAIILISHDLGVIARNCNEVAVMYRGKIIEKAPTDKLFSNMTHPYTRGLLASIPSVDQDRDWLEAIPGRVPLIDEKITGCAFHPRCAFTEKPCTQTAPRLIDIRKHHAVRCHFAGEF
ncbi:dipeptide ABC transporter ATP-binding protein DppD [Chromatiales bacterium (ex Bugula neritina AB1)]|nr:dipeptide ABC transporter ATP-binding protein DppD [Chromatiales bacterium (ex Bugula neritina AB1)]